MLQMYKSPSLGKIRTDKLLEDISQFIKKDAKDGYRLVIGTDSKYKLANGHSECDYVTVIVIHKKGSGAKYYWKKEKIKGKVVLRDKIYMETMKSLETANYIVPLLAKYITEELYDLEIHIDVGNKGETRTMVKEVVGMVTGGGFTAKVKPESWGASTVADRYT